MRSALHRCTTIALAALMMGALAPASVWAADDDEEGVKLNWQKGPTKGQLGSQAEVVVPAGYRFVGQKETIALLQAMGNLTGGDEMGLLLVMKRGRVLNFDPSSTEKAAAVFPTTATIAGPHPAQYDWPGFPYALTITG